MVWNKIELEVLGYLNGGLIDIGWGIHYNSRIEASELVKDSHDYNAHYYNIHGKAKEAM